MRSSHTHPSPVIDLRPPSVHDEPSMTRVGNRRLPTPQVLTLDSRATAMRTARRGISFHPTAATPGEQARWLPQTECGREFVVGQAAGSWHLPQRDAEAPALLPFPGVHLAVRVAGPGLRGAGYPLPSPSGVALRRPVSITNVSHGRRDLAGRRALRGAPPGRSAAVEGGDNPVAGDRVSVPKAHTGESAA
jgi:hypothetical protein